MNIVQITPGAGDEFYCENCLRDGALVRGLRSAGHDVQMVPLYLPPADDRGEIEDRAPIFFGAVNVFLQQKLALFRRTPRWLDRPLDATGLLRWAGRKGGATSATSLGEMTLSMLRGEHGRQVKELRRLVRWLGETQRPDVVCLSNALLLGLARRIRNDLGSTIVCMLQDEDGFLDGLPEPYSRQAWELLAERTGEVNAFVASSRYYADVMCDRLGLPAARVRVVPNGIDPEGYAPPGAPPTPPTVGFLSQMCRAKGLDTLVDAFVHLKAAPGLGDLRLKAAGGKTSADEMFHVELSRRLSAEGLTGDVEFLSDFHRTSKQAMLASLSVLSVPTKQPEASALFVLEALAAGVPVVLPDHGVCRELVEATGGGLLVTPNDAEALADALKDLLLDADRARAMGAAGRDAVLRDFPIHKTAAGMIDVYRAAASEAT